MPSYRSIEEFFIPKPERVINRYGRYEDSPDKNHPWTKYFGKISYPSIEGSSISCGVRQLFGLHNCPPYLVIQYVILKLKAVQKWSQAVFSDIGGEINEYVPWKTDDLLRGLYTRKELDLLEKGVQPSTVMATLIDESKGVLGIISASSQTRNRNTGNRIRTYIWTMPYHTSQRDGEVFDFDKAVDYLNIERAECTF